MPHTPDSPKIPCTPSSSTRQSLRGKATIQKLEQKLRAAHTQLTVSKQAAKQLKLSEVQYREIFNAATDGLLIFDLNANIVEANPQVCKMHQYSHKEFLKLSAKDFIHPEYYHLFHQFKKDMRRKGQFQAEVLHMRRDGTIFPVDVRGTDIVYRGTKHLLAITRDITARKKAEEALRRSEKELRALSSKLLSVQEDEKKRLALELHDGFGQTLIAIKFGVENSLGALDDSDPATAAQSLTEVVAIVQRAIDEVRRVTTSLRPTILDNLGIVATISWFCQEFQRICPAIRVKEHITVKEKEVPQLLKSTVFRIMQEAFTNIAKHSKARLAQLSLTKKKQGIELYIRDNGQGFNPEKPAGTSPGRRGMGLTSMHERTMLSGGTFSIASEPGKGTSVRATWSTGRP